MNPVCPHWFLNTASNIADGAITNIFIVKDENISTPRVLDGALPGVVRSILLEEFNHLFSITEKSISFSEIMDADEVFLTNAIIFNFEGSIIPVMTYLVLSCFAINWL